MNRGMARGRYGTREVGVGSTLRVRRMTCGNSPTESAEHATRLSHCHRGPQGRSISWGVTRDNDNAFISNHGRRDRPLYCVGRKRGNIRHVQGRRRRCGTNVWPHGRRRNDANGLYAIRVQPRHQDRLRQPECATWLGRRSKCRMESWHKAAWIAPIIGSSNQ